MKKTQKVFVQKLFLSLSLIFVFTSSKAMLSTSKKQTELIKKVLNQVIVSRNMELVRIKPEISDLIKKIPVSEVNELKRIIELAKFQAIRPIRIKS